LIWDLPVQPGVEEVKKDDRGEEARQIFLKFDIPLFLCFELDPAERALIR
jgi:hypothetical protein